MADNASIAEAEFLDEKQYDSSDPEQVNKARAVAGRRKRKSLSVVEALMRHADGREWLYMLLTACDVYRLSYMRNESHSDMCFREGKKFIGLQLLADIEKASPQNYMVMLKECKDKKMQPLFPMSGLE